MVGTTRTTVWILGALWLLACEGENGARGARGETGAPGEPGDPGASVTTAVLMPGDDNCPNGGLEVTNAEGERSFVCNGDPGATGTDGEAGPRGADGAEGPRGRTGPGGPAGPAGSAGGAVVATVLPTGDAHCAFGGVRFDVDGGSTYACNGAAGATGPGGATGAIGPQGLVGASVVAASLGLGDPHCPAGGASFTVDGTSFAYACNGAGGAVGPTGPAGSNGAQGATGPQGASGSQGATGATGPQGPIGLLGPTGPQGPTGSPGATGAPGSSGAAGPTGPAGPSGTAGQGIAQLFGTGTVTITPASGFTGLPGLSTTIDVPVGGTIYIQADGGVMTSSAAATGFSTVDVAVIVDGNFTPSGGYKRVTAANTTGLVTMIANWSVALSVPLTPGVHTVAVFAAGTGSGSNASLSGDATSVLQGELSVLILKQ